MKRLLLFLFIFLVACTEQKLTPDVDALVYEQAKPLSEFSLISQHGEVINNSALMGQWNVIFLGYTSCPDICPLTLAKLSAVYQKLHQQLPMQVWFVAVDPKRDTIAKRKQYIDHFNPDFLAVSGEHKDLFPFVRELGLIYAISNSDEAEYAVDHSASIALVDPQGAVRAIFKPEFKAGSVPLVSSEKLIAQIPTIAEFYTE